MMEREAIRVATRGEKWCRPQPVSKNSTRATAESEPNVFGKHFGLFAGGVVFLWVCLRVFDFTLLPPAYNGILITQPFCGLRSWDLADRAWAARSHLKYGLDYTKGLRTLVVGDPPPLIPEYCVSHPPLETWILALGMLVFGTQDWSVRLFELVFSVPCLLLILLMLRKLHGSMCALLSGLFLVMLPYSAYFGMDPLMIVLTLWAFYRYLLLTGHLGNSVEAKPRHLCELGVALFLLVQYNWIGIFYAFTIGLHYVWNCWRMRYVRWNILTALALPSLMSLTLNFCIMIWGMQHNIMVESPSKDSVLFAKSEHDTPWTLLSSLYQWWTRTDERSSFSWIAWAKQNLEYAETDFTAALLFLGAYLLYLLLARVRILRQRLMMPVEAVGREGSTEAAYPFRYMWFYLLPGLFFIFTFKGLTWRHQYWQSPLALFVAIGSALALLAVGDVFSRVHRRLGRLIAVVLILVVAGFCNQGLASYRAIRWQSTRTISLFKELNRRIPPDRALLTFKDFMIQQNKGEVAAYRGEYAWYLDREMIVANAWRYNYYWMTWMRSARIGEVVKETVREVQGHAETGCFSYYLIPACEEYRHDPLSRERLTSGVLIGMDAAPIAEQVQQDASSGTLGMAPAGIASLPDKELDRRLHENDPRDALFLLWEKHRRYREAVVARLKELYQFEYYANTALPGNEDFCYAGITPCYLFDLFRPK
jgi:4-amino-4-deoxy-L-arabinose transferase-like glycosyltransferase